MNLLVSDNVKVIKDNAVHFKKKKSPNEIADVFWLSMKFLKIMSELVVQDYKTIVNELSFIQSVNVLIWIVSVIQVTRNTSYRHRM